MKLDPRKLHIARQCLLEEVTKYFINRKGVKALYIQGSVAANSADEFSDIDFRIVVEPKVYAKYISERFSAPKQWGEWLYNEWTNRTWVCVSHFKPFNKIDVLYFKPEELKPSPWFTLPTQIIYDPEELVQKVVEDSQNSKHNLFEIEEIDRVLSKGLAYAEEVCRRAIRGELFYAQSQLDSFRWVLVQLDDYINHSSVSSGFGSSSHFEQRGSETIIKAMERSHCSLEKQSIFWALKELLKAYQSQIIQLYQILPLKRDQAIDLYWVNYMIELCDSNV